MEWSREFQAQIRHREKNLEKGEEASPIPNCQIPGNSNSREGGITGSFQRRLVSLEYQSGNGFSNRILGFVGFFNGKNRGILGIGGDWNF